MKSYALFFVSVLLLLFALPKTGGNMSSLFGMEQSALQKACASGQPGKRSCEKKCLRHQTHSGQQNAANLAIDCSQQFYAVVANQARQAFGSMAAGLPGVMLPATKKLLSPYLEDKSKPPRHS